MHVKFKIGLPLLALSAALLFAGCAVFEAVGDFFSTGYSNTVAYFNVYYNASRTFDEAESEVQTAAVTAGTSSALLSDKLPPVPASTKQKFGLVIDKCSKILAFHATSSFVDDALLLIGKSYYYLGDFLKAERKFSELLSRYPNESTAPEGQLWLMRTYARLGKDNELLTAGDILIPASSNAGDDEIAGEALSLVAAVEAKQGKTQEAIGHYERAADLSGGAAEWEIDERIGDLWYTLGNDQESASYLQKAVDGTDDPLVRHRAGLALVQAYRDLGDHARANEVCDELLGDYRLLKYTADFELEKARLKVDEGDTLQAMDLFREIDSTNANTPAGGTAAYEYAELNRTYARNYEEAEAAYGRALVGSPPDIAALARAKSAALRRYANLIEERSRIDSVLSASRDTSGAPPDSLLAVADTLASPPDSLRKVRPPVNVDSLQVLKRWNASELAEVFYGGLEESDSAATWYRRVLETDADSARVARALFALADIESSGQDSIGEDARGLYRRIVDEYPGSRYALAARQRLGMPEPEQAADPAQALYAHALRQLDEGSYQSALRTLATVRATYPQSPFAAKSLYAEGWIYENKLDIPDSAVARYTALVQHYQNTTYADAVKLKIAPEAKAPASGDSVSTPSQTTPPPPVGNQQKDQNNRKLPGEAPRVQ